MISLRTAFSIFLVLFISTIIHADKIQDYKAISNILQNGIQLVINDDLAGGHAAFNKANELAKIKGYEDLVAVIMVSQSKLYSIQNDAESEFRNLLDIAYYFKKDTTSSLAGDYYEYIGKCFIEQNKLIEALQALTICERIRLKTEPSKNWRTYNGMARVYNRLKDAETAEQFSKKAEKLAKIQNSRKSLLDLKNALAFNEKDGTIAILSSENKQTKIDLQRIKYRYTMLVFGLSAFALICTLLFILLKQRSRLNKAILHQNEIISKNLQEKEFLIKEIHHRVKNNLQVISSLLSLQSRSVDDKQAIDALNESQSRVVSMSLIHQNLYKDGNSSHLDLKYYLELLTQNLFNTYNIRHDQIKLELDVDPVMIDVGNLVPMGLIINELITNALKYAFVGKDQGKIVVQCKEVDGALHLKVKDDGIGITPMNNQTGFGNRLVQAFANRLEGELHYQNVNGTEVLLVIQNYKKAS